MLRLDWNLLFNIINLVLLYFLMKRFLFRPVNTILEKRQAEADEQFARAGEAKNQAMDEKQQYEKLLKDAEKEKEKIVVSARKEASEEYGRILEDAREKADDIVKSARRDAEAEKKAVLNQADAQLKDMIVAAAAKMAGVGEDADSDRKLYDRFIEKANQSL